MTIVKNLALTVFFSFLCLLRFLGNDYDGGSWQHPDERMILMVVDRISLFDNLNPDFFNYGSFPLYFLRIVYDLIKLIFFNYFSFDFSFLAFVGRVVSSIIDCLVILVVYYLAKFLFNNKSIALFASLFYGLFFFPIQNSNFYVVDNFINFFLSLFFLVLLKLVKKFSFKKIILLALLFALLITTKITPIIFLPIVFFIFCFKFKKLKLIISYFLCWIILVIIFSFIFMPYGFFEYKRFFQDINQQIKMNNDAYIFPYTLQYVDTIAYVQPIKNIFLVGVGPLAFLIFLFGLLAVGKKIKLAINNCNSPIKLLFFYLSFNIYYFLIIGRSAVKFMRYFLPLYPFIAIVAGLGLWLIIKKLRYCKKIFFGLVLSGQILYCWTFLNIYQQKHSRLQASEWINKNIPNGSTLTVEHWDDRLPLSNGENFKYLELTLYDFPDDKFKWIKINQNLTQADYIILASNRLSKPLSHLFDCQKFKRCYPLTANYYQNLINGKLNFILVATFQNSPRIPLLNWLINDDSIDESFSVYDHPKVLIFKKYKV